MRLARYGLAGIARVGVALVGPAGCGALMDPSEVGNLVPATVDEDSTLPFLDLNGTRLHVRTFGDPSDPVIVFLHGGPGSSLFGLLPYHEVYEGHSLADDHFLVFWDQRGAGLSRRHDPADLSWDRYIQDLDLLVDHVSPDTPVHLVGYSFGGTYAASYVDRFPHKVDGLVLLSPAPLSGRAYLEAPFLPRGLSEGRSDVAWTSEYFTTDDHARLDYAMATAAMDGLDPRFGVDVDALPSFRRWGFVCQWMLYFDLGILPPVRKGEAPDYDFTENLGDFEQPVLAFAGGEDRLFTADFERTQLQSFRDSELVVIEGYGHDVAFDYATIQPRIREYLAARDERRRAARGPEGMEASR